MVSLSNVSEKDVKGLLFRKRQTVEFRFFEIEKQFKLYRQFTELE